MIIKYDLYSGQLKRNVHIHMYLPDDYLSSQQQYPVLYMFDGHNLFFDEDATYGRSWRLLNYLYELPKPMIVVGLECNHEGLERLNEYAPYPFYDPDFSRGFEGRGRQTMNFIIRTLKPYVDLHFPTLPDRGHTWIAGSSCGGLMAIYALYAYSPYFSRAAALSPYVLPSISSLLTHINRQRLRLPSALYLSWGAKEGNSAHEFVQETVALTNLANILLKKGVKIQFDVSAAGEHCEAQWESLAYTFLRFLEK